MSRDYQRGYGKGYSTGCKHSDAENHRLWERANNAAKRAELAESAKGIGHCEDCAHWVRGGLDSYAEKRNRAWGTCNLKDSAGTPYGTRMWSDAAQTPINTTPKFGCVLFQHKDSASLDRQSVCGAHGSGDTSALPEGAEGEQRRNPIGES